MNWVDFWIVFFVVLILVLIIVFTLIIPKIKHKNKCDYCSSPKRIKRALKKYRKENSKKDI